MGLNAEIILQAALDRVAGGWQAEAVFTNHDLSLTRFAGSRIHQNVSQTDATVRLRVERDGQTGVASTNRLDSDGLDDLARRAAAIGQKAAPNPDAAPLAGPPAEAVHSRIGWEASTAAADPVQRAEGARAVIAAGSQHGLEVSGAFSTESMHLAVANSRGLMSSHQGTTAKLLTVMMDGKGSSGYAQATSPDIDEIDAAAVGAEAAERGARSAGATDLEPGEYPVVLSEYAMHVVLEYLAEIAFSGLALLEGRSCMPLGERVMGDTVTIWDDGRDPSGLPAAIDFEGVAKQRVMLVEEGIGRGVVHDSVTAKRAGTTSTGHGLPAPNIWGPVAWNLFMAPGTTPRSELVAGMERGVLVTRFWYLSVVHSKRGLLTGMTKDGTFWVENGQIVRPIRNLRWTQSIPEAFSRISALSNTSQLILADYSGIAARVPAARIDSWNFTGATVAETDR